MKKQLKDYDIDTDISDNRVVLAEILQNKLNDETSQHTGKLFLTINCSLIISKLIFFFFQIIEVPNTETIDIYSDSRQVSDYTLDFALSSGWALKENQKFGKKGGGKRISKYVISYLEAYFLAGDINKSEKYTAQEMHNELKG